MLLRSTFNKGIASGQGFGDSIAAAFKQLDQSLIDTLSKSVTSSLLGSVSKSLLGSATDTAGATASAGILTSAGTTLAASMIAGATEAASILGVAAPTAGASLASGGTLAAGALLVGGTKSGIEVGAGGVSAAAALVGAAPVIGTAIWGPLVAAIALAAAVAGSLLFSGESEADKRAQAAADQRGQDLLAQLSGIIGSLQANEEDVLVREAKVVPGRNDLLVPSRSVPQTSCNQIAGKSGTVPDLKRRTRRSAANDNEKHDDRSQLRSTA